MNCPYYATTTTRKRAKQTKLGYTTFFCPQCQCTINERTGTPFNYLEFLLTLCCWLSYGGCATN